MAISAEMYREMFKVSAFNTNVRATLLEAMGSKSEPKLLQALITEGAAANISVKIEDERFVKYKEMAGDLVVDMAEEMGREVIKLSDVIKACIPGLEESAAVFSILSKPHAEEKKAWELVRENAKELKEKAMAPWLDAKRAEGGLFGAYSQLHKKRHELSGRLARWAGNALDTHRFVGSVWHICVAFRLSNA